jgi:SAM-dependent methyltransferase
MDSSGYSMIPPLPKVLSAVPPDPLELYRWAVQDPQTHVAVLTRMYARLRNRQPAVLREDFAGTSAESVAWVAAADDRTAIAVDHDPATLAWARRRAERLLGERSANVRFVEGDVLSVAPLDACGAAHPSGAAPLDACGAAHPSGAAPLDACAAAHPSGAAPLDVPAADVISVLNFSIFHFHRRGDLAAYFEHARRSLAADGILVLNAFGGPGALRATIDRRRVEPAATTCEPAPPPFEYRWEQRGYDAVANRLDCRIHFVVDGTDGNSTTIEDAFQYDWRVWTLPELTELIRETGFTDAQVWRHTYDPSKGTDGVFLGPVDRIENADTWLAYVIAVR